MKLKYFIRGLGIGIIFGAIVMLVAYNTSDKEKLSDAEIIERAEKLGMVMQEATQTDAQTTDTVTTEAKSEATTEAITEATKATTATTEVTTAESVTTEEITEETTEKKTETKTTEEKSDNSYTEATITVTSGMGSTEVAGLLEEAGIIEDAAEFDGYLVKQGISNKIQINTYKFNSNMSYEDIAAGLTTPNND